MKNRFDASRRQFLKTGIAAVGVGVFLSTVNLNPAFADASPIGTAGKQARVAIPSLSVYSQPWDEARIIYQAFRDDLMNVYYEVESDHGPGYNPYWYRVWGGYIHSGHVQLVDTRLNQVDYSVNSAPAPGVLGEVTVPFTQAKLHNRDGSWRNVYRLYYESVHWVVGVETGPDGRAWYRLKDEFFDVDSLDYFIAADHMRIIPTSELTPVSVDVPWTQKRIEIKIGLQQLAAFEYDREIFRTTVSTGIIKDVPDGQIPTATPTGTFNIQNKMPSKHMGDGNLTDDPDAYELPGVPWVSFFEPVTGVALHGTYWHRNWGLTMSRGCVNMRNEEAKWLYRWCTPRTPTLAIDTIGLGTQVIVS